jgi:hypothetical protein
MDQSGWAKTRKSPDEKSVKAKKKTLGGTLHAKQCSSPVFKA